MKTLFTVLGTFSGANFGSFATIEQAQKEAGLSKEETRIDTSSVPVCTDKAPYYNAQDAAYDFAGY